jgi:hypothetical protein
LNLKWLKNKIQLKTDVPPISEELQNLDKRFKPSTAWKTITMGSGLWCILSQNALKKTQCPGIFTRLANIAAIFRNYNCNYFQTIRSMFFYIFLALWPAMAAKCQHCVFHNSLIMFIVFFNSESLNQNSLCFVVKIEFL